MYNQVMGKRLLYHLLLKMVCIFLLIFFYKLYYRGTLLGKSGLGRRNFDMERKVEGKVQDAKKFTDFRQRKQASLLKTRIISDLRKSKLACHQLDSACGCTSPAVDWYWPEEFVPKEEEEEEEEEEESDSDEDELLEIEVKINV